MGIETCVVLILCVTLIILLSVNT